MRDELPARVGKNENAVVNLDSGSGPGTHWVAFCKPGSDVFYYDSFGVYPPEELISYLGKKCCIQANCEQEQKFNDVICGQLCLDFLASINNKYGK